MPRPRFPRILFTGGFLAIFGFNLIVSAREPSAEAFSKRFSEEIYPLLTRTIHGDSCVDCHDSLGTSDLVFLGDAQEDFKTLWQSGYFDTDAPDGLLSRVTSPSPKRRMPKKQPAWSAESITTLRNFLTDLGKVERPAEVNDESFPIALLAPYKGETPEGLDNQFLGYRQLRTKVEQVFGRGWSRGERDLFAENIAMFGGADFETRFNESTRASSNFLTALDMVSRDVVERAFNERSSPFAEWLDKEWKARLDHLYQRFLYRLPSGKERDEARRLFDRLASAETAVGRRAYELAFALSVHDPQTGEEASAEVRVPVEASLPGVHQYWIDQSTGESITLKEPVRCDPEDPDKPLFILYNEGSIDNVSFAGLTLEGADGSGDSVRINADSDSVRAVGAWQHKERKGTVSYEDEGLDKGESRIEVSLDVPVDTGDYELTLHWRKATDNARRVFVEVRHPHQSQIRLATPPPDPLPHPGEAAFFYDSSEDSKPYFEPPATFRFSDADDQGVRITNESTDDLVTAGALEFLSTEDGDHFLVDSREAEGQEAWADFKSRSFGAYNQKGTSVSDEDREKGPLFLHYHPRIKHEAAWNPDHLYRLRLYYAGKRGHETRVPFTVRAASSTPVLKIRHPLRAHVGGLLSLDASSSYTTQQNPLVYHWTQIGGPPVAYDSSNPRLDIILPRWKPESVFWQALARALMRHPDFLFTRPPSIASFPEGPERRRLQLVKLAQDLVGRPPSEREFQALEDGETLGDIVSHYLQSQDFQDFYFHRIRLYLESQGTTEQDEPARLWSYIAFNDRPFQEILTADYTVDPQWRRQERAAHHGRTGVLTTKGFIQGKPGLPHYNYAAQVSMLFLGYVYEVPPEIVEQREGITAAGTTDPQSTCYSCHKILTPLAHQRNRWTDDGDYRTETPTGLKIDASDHGLVQEYPFKGEGLEAFATQAIRKERFIRTIIDTHFSFYFGRQMRFREDERALYRRVWDAVHADGFKIRTLIQALVTSPEYLEGRSPNA